MCSLWELGCTFVKANPSILQGPTGRGCYFSTQCRSSHLPFHGALHFVRTSSTPISEMTAGHVTKFGQWYVSGILQESSLKVFPLLCFLECGHDGWNSSVPFGISADLEDESHELRYVPVCLFYMKEIYFVQATVTLNFQVICSQISSWFGKNFILSFDRVLCLCVSSFHWLAPRWWGLWPRTVRSSYILGSS